MILVAIIINTLLVLLIASRDKEKDYSGATVLMGVMATIALWGLYFSYLYFIESRFW